MLRCGRTGRRAEIARIGHGAAIVTGVRMENISDPFSVRLSGSGGK